MDKINKIKLTITYTNHIGNQQPLIDAVMDVSSEESTKGIFTSAKQIIRKSASQKALHFIEFLDYLEKKQ